MQTIVALHGTFSRMSKAVAVLKVHQVRVTSRRPGSGASTSASSRSTSSLPASQEAAGSHGSPSLFNIHSQMALIMNCDQDYIHLPTSSRTLTAVVSKGRGVTMHSFHNLEPVKDSHSFCDLFLTRQTFYPFAYHPVGAALSLGLRDAGTGAGSGPQLSAHSSSWAPGAVLASSQSVSFS